MFCACGCGQELKPFDDYGRPHKFIHGHNKGRLGQSGPTGAECYQWKGGTINWSGYRMIRRNRRWVREHRILYEEYHKCCLLSWSHIHHINGNKRDNRKENLEGMTHSQHSTLTHKGKPKCRNK